MIAAMLLLYAGVLALGAPRALSGAWTIRHPRAGLLAWHVVIGTVLASGLAAALLAAHDAWRPLASMSFGTDPTAGNHPSIGVAVLDHEWNASLLVLLVLSLRVLLVAVRRIRGIQHERAQVRAAVATLSPTTLAVPYGDVSIIALPEPTAFCIPGPWPQIVLSQAALMLLSPDQLVAVVSHERAHLRHRHAAVATWSALLAESFPWWALAQGYAREVPRLHEMHADDRAAQVTDGRVVTASLLALSAPNASGALAMSGADVATRATRLLQPPRPARGPLTGLGVGLGVVLMIPLALFAGPGMSAVASAHHPDHGHVATSQGL